MILLNKTFQHVYNRLRLCCLSQDLKDAPKLMITHPEDQEVSAKEDLRLIVILLDRQCVATSV